MLINEFDPKGYDSKPIFDVYEKFIGKLKAEVKLIRRGTSDFEKFQNDTGGEGLIKSDYESYLKFLEDLQKLKDNPKLAADLKTVAEKITWQ